jgi:putative transposase
MAASQKRATDQRAHLVLIDESGMMLAPLVRRTLAPAGQTPLIRQKGAHRERVSLIAGLSISPVRRQIGLYFDTLDRGYINNERAADFLRHLLRSLRGKVMVVWDRGNMHRGAPINKLIAKVPRLELHSFPPYAPELNPVEQLWNHLKYHRFVNYAPPNSKTLNQKVRKHLRHVQTSKTRLQSFLSAANIPFDW